MQMKSRYDVIAVAKQPPPGPVVTGPAVTHFLGFQLMTDPSLMVKRIHYEIYHIISLINFNIHHPTDADSLVQRRCVYPCVPTRRVGGRKGLRLAISDLVTVSVEPGGKRIPIDALPVAARRVLITRHPATMSAWICPPCRPAMIPPVHTMIGRCAGTAQTYWPLCPVWQL